MSPSRHHTRKKLRSNPIEPVQQPEPCLRSRIIDGTSSQAEETESVLADLSIVRVRPLVTLVVSSAVSPKGFPELSETSRRCGESL